MKYDKEKIGKRILEERTRLGLTQEELGEKLGDKTSKTRTGKTISTYESGIIFPPIEVLAKMCEIFNCEMGYLLCENDYSDKTKLRSLICDELGLTSKSIDKIISITKSKYFSGDDFLLNKYSKKTFENNIYALILNRILSSNSFCSIISALRDAESNRINLEEKNNEIESRMSVYTKEEFEKAWLLFASDIDYENENLITSKRIISALHLIEEKIECLNGYKNLREIKISKYEANESFHNLINEIYPFFSNNYHPTFGKSDINSK